MNTALCRGLGQGCRASRSGAPQASISLFVLTIFPDYFPWLFSLEYRRALFHKCADALSRVFAVPAMALGIGFIFG